MQAGWPVRHKHGSAGKADSSLTTPELTKTRYLRGPSPFAQNDTANSELPLNVAAAADLVLAAGDAGDGFGVGDVLFDEDAVGEGVCVVGVENRDGALEDDGAVVEVFVDEVDGAAGDFHAVVECLLLGVESRESGQQ